MTRQDDINLEAQIVALGLTAPRVTVEQIDSLMQSLSYSTHVVPGTTTTVAAAIGPGGFVVELGFSAAASSENFDEVIGRNRAISRAKEKARGKLWELEGWRLKRNLLDLAEAGLLERILDPEVLKGFGDHWASVAVPTAVAIACSGCSRCYVSQAPGCRGSAVAPNVIDPDQPAESAE